MNDRPDDLDGMLDQLFTSGETVDKPVETIPIQRLLVIGSHEWIKPAWIAQAVLDWWIEQDRPKISLLVEQARVGAFALHIFAEDMMHEMYGLAPDTRNPERRRRQAMLQHGVSHAFVFRQGADQRIVDWIDDLHAHQIPTTIVSFDEVVVEEQS